MSGLLNDLRAVWMHDPNVNATKEDDAAYARLRAFIKANGPWCPPVPVGFGPWIEFTPGDKGPGVGEVVDVLTQNERDNRCYDKDPRRAKNYPWDKSIVAYCVKLEDGE